MGSADFGRGEGVDLRGVDERFDGYLFPFRIARTAGWTVIQRFNSKPRHHRSVGVPENRSVLGRAAEYSSVAQLDCPDQLMIFGNFGARNGDERFELDSVIG